MTTPTRALTSLVSLLLLGSGPVRAQPAPSAPKDQPHALAAEDLAENERALAPYIKTARETYPAARARFLDGLPPGQYFFVVTRLVDSKGHWEQVFIRVATIAGESITGTIASEITLVAGFTEGQPYAFTDSELIDWLITKPDGSEEGNVVGKFLDTYKP
jgi:hypothetical protein